MGSQRSLTWIYKEWAYEILHEGILLSQATTNAPTHGKLSKPPSGLSANVSNVYKCLPTIDQCVQRSPLQLLPPWCLQPETAAHGDSLLQLSNSLDSEQHTVQGQTSCCLSIRVHADHLTQAFLHLCVWFFFSVCSSFSCLPHQMSRTKPRWTWRLVIICFFFFT